YEGPGDRGGRGGRGGRVNAVRAKTIEQDGRSEMHFRVDHDDFRPKSARKGSERCCSGTSTQGRYRKIPARKRSSPHRHLRFLQNPHTTGTTRTLWARFGHLIPDLPEMLSAKCPQQTSRRFTPTWNMRQTNRIPAKRRFCIELVTRNRPKPCSKCGLRSLCGHVPDSSS